MTPNTQITQENVGLLKAGDRVKVSYHGTSWDGIGTVVDVNTKWRSSVGVERKDVGTGNFTPDCITFLSRPALSPPAEGEVCDGCDTSGRCTYVGNVCTPTPAPADHIGDATEKVDWQRVGPKLVEALEFYAKDHDFPNDGPWGINSQDFGDVARAALAETDTVAGKGVADRFLSWLEREIDEASMDIGAAHQEGGAATEAERERASCLGFVRERYLALAAQPSAGAEPNAIERTYIQRLKDHLRELERSGRCSALAHSLQWAIDRATPAQPDTGDVAALREALERARVRFEAIRLLLVSHNDVPGREAYWAAVFARAAVDDDLAALSKPNAPGAA